VQVSCLSIAGWLKDILAALPGIFICGGESLAGSLSSTYRKNDFFCQSVKPEKHINQLNEIPNKSPEVCIDLRFGYVGICATNFPVRPL